jgi:hypothetical protein
VERDPDEEEGTETTVHPPASPLAIIEAITKGNENPEKKIKDLSQAFAKYHQDTSLRMRHLKNNMANILARLNEYPELTTETNTNNHQQ